MRRRSVFLSGELSEDKGQEVLQLKHRSLAAPHYRRFLFGGVQVQFGEPGEARTNSGHLHVVSLFCAYSRLYFYKRKRSTRRGRQISPSKYSLNGYPMKTSFFLKSNAANFAILCRFETSPSPFSALLPWPFETQSQESLFS